MKSLRMFAAMMLALLLAFSTAAGFGSTGFQHDQSKGCKDNKDNSKKDSKKDKVDKAIDDLDKALDADKEKKSKKEKEEPKKEKDSKKDKDKYDKAIDDLDKALEGDKGKGSKKDDSDSKKEKDSEKGNNDSEKDAKNDKPSDEDYEGTYSGYRDNRYGQGNSYEIAFKLKKAKKGPLYTVAGAIRKQSPGLGGGHLEPEIYSVQGAFSPKTGKLTATYKAQSKNALGKGNVDGEYENGSFTIKIGRLLVIEEVTKQ